MSRKMPTSDRPKEIRKTRFKEAHLSTSIVDVLPTISANEEE